MSVFEAMRKALEVAISRVADSAELPTFSLEAPEDVGHGDYATNAALVLAKRMKRLPMEVAKEIAEHVKSDNWEVAASLPGFVNFRLAHSAIVEIIADALERQNQWGGNDTLRGKKIIVEYTDPNPFKELHVGHLMSNAIGEALSRIMEASGAEVRRANYQGDVGMHVAKALWGVMALGEEGLTAERDLQKKVAFLGRAYAEGARTYEENEDAKKEIQEINKKVFTESDKELAALYHEGKAASLKYFDSIYARLGTRFDYLFFESETGGRGARIVAEGLTKGVLEKSDGAIVFRGERRGLHTRVFINSEGLPTYEAKELGLAELKQEVYPHDYALVITGNEIVGYFKVVLSAMEELMPGVAKKITHIPHGMLRLKVGKMSSRTGEVIRADDLLDLAKETLRKRVDMEKGIADAVAVGAVKYSILRQSSGKDIIFDFDTSLSFEGDSGPYLQYTYARARSVLENAREQGIASSLERVPEEIMTMERLLIHFPEVVLRARENYDPHYIATYLFSLAQAFNSFYAEERIVDSGEEAPFRLALTEAVALTIQNGLWLLGVSAPERM